MNSEKEIAARLAHRFGPRWLRDYVRIKLRTDPAYRTVRELVSGSNLPLLDIGCGVGLLPFYLREHGIAIPLTGLDTDRKKIEMARSLATRFAPDVRLIAGELSSIGDFSGSVALLDVLHYLNDEDQAVMLRWIAEAVPSGGMAIIRECPRDGSWRQRVTWMEEVFARGIGWMRTRIINFPTPESIGREFVSRGFSEEIRPLWGRTPFNSQLFVYRREVGGER